METVASRPLGAFERAQYLTGKRFPFNLVVSLHLAGPISTRALERALGELQGAHPLLRCSIGLAAGEPEFRLGDRLPGVPVRHVEQAAEAAWRREVESELERPLDAGRAPLFRCTLLSNPTRTRHELLFTFHHAIADARAVATFLRELLHRACGGPGDDVWETSIPPSADSRLPSAFRGWRGGVAAHRLLARLTAGEVAYRWRTRGQRPAPPAGDFHCRILPVALSEEETEALVRATRRHRVSVGSALNAAMLLAVVRRREAGGPLLHRYPVFPLLRPYLEPPIADSVFASYFSIMMLTTRVDPNGDFWELAAAIHRQTDAAAKRGEKFLTMRWSPFLMKSVLNQESSRMATVGVNYAGGIEIESPSEELRVEELHAFVSNFPLGPVYTAQARVFRRRLWLDVLYLDADLSAAEAGAIAGDVQELLEVG